jgi:hypothetical protein
MMRMPARGQGMTATLINRVKFTPAAHFTREQASGALPLPKGGLGSLPADLGTTRPMVRPSTPLRREHPDVLSSSLPALNSQLAADAPIRA